VAVLATMLAALAVAAPAKAPRTDHVLWRAAEDGFAAWALSGVERTVDGEVRLARGRRSGEAISPVVTPAVRFTEAIPSWNAATPRGTWLEVGLRARAGSRWTRWWSLGIWSSTDLRRRHSVGAQRDASGHVATDTLALARRADAVQLRLRLRSKASASPSIRLAAVAVSAPTGPAPRAASGRATLLDVPEYSQMVYRDGGEVWCSPTSLAMVLAYWQRYRGRPGPRVRRTVAGVYDPSYRGHGNWPFNTAFAATEGLEATVARLADLREAEDWVAAGVPVIVSFGWKRGELPGAGGSSDGHLAVVVGFQADGDPIVNDPAARTNAAVRRAYPRTILERLWRSRSNGTAYLVYPPGRAIPPLLR
jgi:hypothetical protein